MTPEYLAVLAIVAVLSVVQSFFGMGLLIFGTPALLLMGHDFISTLGYVLPASFVISLLQVWFAGSSRVPVSRHLYLFCLPAIGIGLWFAEASPLASWTNILIGGVLLVSALVRIWPTPRRLLIVMLKKYVRSFHFLMGAVHGLTNLGGAILAIFASGTHDGKEAIRYTVAHYYLAFSAIQMLLLATVMGHRDMLIANIPAVAVSAAVYLLIGRHIFTRASNPFYNSAMTVFIAAYGIAVLFKF